MMKVNNKWLKLKKIVNKKMAGSTWSPSRFMVGPVEPTRPIRVKPVWSDFLKHWIMYFILRRAFL